MVCRVYKPKATVAQNKRVVWAYNHSVTVGVLPVSMFANGHIFFVQKLYEVCDVTHFLRIVFWPPMHHCLLATHAPLLRHKYQTVDLDDLLKACSDEKFNSTGCV